MFYNIACYLEGLKTWKDSLGYDDNIKDHEQDLDTLQKL